MSSDPVIYIYICLSVCLLISYIFKGRCWASEQRVGPLKRKKERERGQECSTYASAVTFLFPSAAIIWSRVDLIQDWQHWTRTWAWPMIFQAYLTVCHFAFDRSASNLATSLRSWTDTRTFHTVNRIRPTHTTERESPSTIMGILGGAGQPGKKKKKRGWASIYTRSPFCLIDSFCRDLTIHLEAVGSDLGLTCHRVKWDPTLILHHDSARKWSALVIIWERTRRCMSRRKAGVHPISSSLWTTLCAERKRIHSSLLCCQWMWFPYQRLQSGVCVCVCV